jgi:hypothetical protein
MTGNVIVKWGGGAVIQLHPSVSVAFGETALQNCCNSELFLETGTFDVNIKLDSQCTYDVTLRAARSTIVAVEEQNALHILIACV